ncbi:MAG: UbiD family decarboxylase, partial [Dehalococcoidia bacterium]|nr:UbiD family decarboxylase [Dehalococcoidia bacterium]
LSLDPYLTMVSVTAIPAQVNEYDVAGGLKGEPIEVTRAETSDLPVPAHAQIVVEGEVPIDDFLPTEGPFGEFAGYMGAVVENSPYIRVKAVTYQRDPVFQGTPPLAPPHEGTAMMSVGRSFAMLEQLRTAGITGIQNVCVTAASAYFNCVVSIKKSYPGHVRDVMGHVWGHPNLFCKHCIVVDEDIDPWNAYKVEWAIGTRVKAGRDIEIVKHGKSNLDPSSPRPHGGVRGAVESDLLGIDATRPVEAYEEMGEKFPASADPSPELIERVRARWKEYGFKS